MPEPEPEPEVAVESPSARGHRAPGARTRGRTQGAALELAVTEGDFSRAPSPSLALIEPRTPSIRVPEPSGTQPCAVCDRPFLAAGPTGHLGRRPVCDRCFLEVDLQLGMVLAMISVVRAYGAVGAASPWQEERAEGELLASARLYERIASRWARARKPLLDWPVGG